MKDVGFQAEQIRDSWLTTDRLKHYATHWHTYPADPYATSKLIAVEVIVGNVYDTEEEAIQAAVAYYDSLDEETLRWEAAEALAAGGWDMHKINFKLS